MGIHDVQWVQGGPDCQSPVFHKRFTAENIKKAQIDISGLGWQELYINGKNPTDDLYVPVNSTYENINGKKLDYPLTDIFDSPTVNYCHYDITEYIQNGDNLISVHLGNGWWGGGFVRYGLPRLAFSIALEQENGDVQYIETDATVLWKESFIRENDVHFGEKQILAEIKDFHAPEYDDSGWENVQLVPAPEGRLVMETCPTDKIIRTISPVLISDQNGKKIYDVGENITGRIMFDTAVDGTLVFEHGERLKDGQVDFSTTGWYDIQIDTFVGDGKPHQGVYPHFTWHGFRYFVVSGGEIENPVCQVIHTDIQVTSAFDSSHDTLNQLYEAYVRTQLGNIHGSIPIDCPHRERLGYTGDGQLAAETVMLLFEARKMYEHWMEEICNCQSKYTGHIQHTAPFVGGGGGPSGWGGAVVVVVYKFFKQYGDQDFVNRYWSNICRWFSYIETRCEDGLVTHEENMGWCLGDWNIPDHLGPDQTALSDAYVNTVLLVKYYQYALEMAEATGNPAEHFAGLEKMHQEAIQKAFWDEKTGNFCENKHGANAFAIDVGMGDGRTCGNLVQHYQKLACFDTGIFGTEVLLRVLFEKGFSTLAFRLLTSDKKDYSFGNMFNNGATTIWEYWDGRESQNQPMFGVSTKYLFMYILGIRNIGFGWDRVEVRPADIPELEYCAGKITTPRGEIYVECRRAGGVISITVDSDFAVELVFDNTRTIIIGRKSLCFAG